jgi:glutathionylspermidine synthase
MAVVGNGSVSSRRWHQNVHYPALTAEAAQRLHEKLDTLSSTCDEFAKRNFEQESRILDLEAHIRYLENLKASYEGLIVAKVGYVMPQPPEPEPFTS